MTEPAQLPWGQPGDDDALPEGGVKWGQLFGRTPPLKIEELGPRPALRMSATGWGAWAACQRKWAFTYNHGFQEESGATGLGTRVHKILEEYLSEGKMPDLGEAFYQAHKRDKNPDGSPVILTYYPGQIASAGLGFWPAPKQVLVEQEFYVKTQSITWHGTMDVKYRTHLPVLGSIPVVGDHKTTTDKKWTKTPDILATDPQGVLYPHALSIETGEANILDRWVYYLTKRGKYDAWVSEYLSTPEARQPILDLMDAGGVEMHRAYEARTHALALPPNPDNCDAFGGCPHRNVRCSLTLKERLGTMHNNPGESLDSFLARQLAGSTGPGEAPTLPGVAAPQLPPALPVLPTSAPSIPAQAAATRPSYWQPGDPMNEAQTFFHGQGKPLFMIASAADNPPPNEVLATMIATPGVKLPANEAGFINPPEAPSQPVNGPAAMPPTTTPPGFVSLPVSGPPALPVATEAVDAFSNLDRNTLKALAVANGIVDESSKLREDSLRTLVRNAHATGQLTKAPEAAPVESVPPIPSRATAPVLPSNTSKAPDGGGPIHTVYVGCMPVQGGAETTQLADLLAPVIAQLKLETKLPHWNLEEYGKGGGRLAASIENYLKSGEYRGAPVVVVDPRAPEAAHCLPVLMRMAEVVVRAIY